MRKIQEILDAALKKGKKRIALAAAQEESAMEAIVDAAKHGLAEPILIGDLAIIKQLAADLKADISGWLLIEEKDYAKAAAKAVELVKSGQADLVMKGILDTSVLLKAVLNKENGLNIGRLTSHVAVMEVPTYHKLFIVSDAAININPDLPGMLDIIANAVQVSKALGVEMPKVALLAAVEKVNADKMPCTATAAVISMMNQRGQIKGCLIDGPLALDNAISAESVKIKKIVSDVAGDADVLVAPDIEAANILYKCLLDLGQAKGASIVVGAAKPVILTSRADTAETKLASIALAVLSC
ncbi:MAG TPA: phosphate butyryltransferase [Spirochaetaceae bacterium]|nr:phosphate butyryltransferase [Spirochaetaceae bacterium]HAW85221.1 phosphate butyryltransferase [Spirochaetaceae bacterium]HAX38367.1 phosphate butyryltransferase [Spirochaetaceae bacterium]HBO41773.1 phosphate butyryltransferase [Spirochaetaceae bacterium]HCQ86224.1 phosphate butyryltransferase [Spirochaetaceae bacterium]